MILLRYFYDWLLLIVGVKIKCYFTDYFMSLFNQLQVSFSKYIISCPYVLQKFLTFIFSLLMLSVKIFATRD